MGSFVRESSMVEVVWYTTDMATLLQERTMRIKMEKVREHKPLIMGQIMVEAGFSPKTAQKPKQLTESKGWAELKAKYLDDEVALATLAELSKPENEDKDNRFKASVEILKLNDRYPALKSKVMGLFQTLDNLEED